MQKHFEGERVMELKILNADPKYSNRRREIRVRSYQQCTVGREFAALTLAAAV